VDLAAVMDELGAALEPTGLRIAPYWADRINPPAALVELPETLTFDAAMRRGGDRIELLVTVAVSKADARTARDHLAPYCDGSGARSVKAAIESHTPTSYDSARVMSAEFGVVVFNAVDYLAARFSVDIIGRGAA
jgi:hypothetical protein